MPVDFVGSRTLPIVKPGYSTAQYLDPNFDKFHFAQGGSTLNHHANWVTAEVAAQRPDLIVLCAGINDLRNGASPRVRRAIACVTGSSRCELCGRQSPS